MRTFDSFDRHRSMRVNATLRNIALVLAFISLVFSVMSGTMLFFDLGDANWWEFVIGLFCFVIFSNIGMHFHVSFKRKD